MRIIKRYVFSSFFVTFSISLIVLSFVSTLGAMMKLSDLVARGVPWRPVLTIFLMSFPQIMSFSIPVSVLVSSLLVFGRLSADNETTAMKACGISTRQIAGLPIFFSSLLTLLCFYLLGEVIPHTHARARSITADLKSVNPIDLLEQGSYSEIVPGMKLYIGAAKGRELFDVRIDDSTDPDENRQLRALRGLAEVDTDSQCLIITLFNVRVEPFSSEIPGSAYMDRFQHRIEIDSVKRIYRKKATNLGTYDLIQCIQAPRRFFPDLAEEDLPRKKSELLVEFHGRFVLSLACLTFAIIGIPLGIKAHRKETTTGLALSFAGVFAYYLLVITGESFSKQPAVYPHLILWIPAVGGMCFGTILLRRSG